MPRPPSRGRYSCFTALAGANASAAWLFGASEGLCTAFEAPLFVGIHGDAVAAACTLLSETGAEGLAIADHVAVGSDQAAPPTARLTPLDREVAVLVAEGRTTAQIAAALGIAPRTVDTHVTHVLSKFGIASRSQVVSALATRHVSGEAVP